MAAYEAAGISDEWYTPAYIFDALGLRFDIDVAAPAVRRHVPAPLWLTAQDDGLKYRPYWYGLIWMNPPFGARNGLVPWLDAFFAHGNGIALTPDRTSAPWWQDAAARADAVVFLRGKVKFEKPDGSLGKSPGTGTTLFAAGEIARAALLRCGLGYVAATRPEAERPALAAE